MNESTQKNKETVISKGLKKEIGRIEAITIVIGVVIGSGIFFKASSVFKNAGTPTLGIMAWLIGGCITIASALTVAEIAVAIPKTGGVFVYIKELYSEKWAFLFGWMQTLIYVPGVAAALSIVFVTQATYFIPDLTPMMQKIFAICILFFVMALNVLSSRLGGKVQVISTIGKLVPIIFIVIFGLINGTAHDFSTTVFASNTSGAAGFGAAILGTLWAYDGWISVGNMAGELKNPEKDLPKSIIMGLIAIIIVYILINAAIINIMPVNDVILSSKPASDAAVILFGNMGAALIAVGIMISIFGALNGYLMTGVRIPFAMAQDNLFPFPKFFGKINEKFETPINTFAFEVLLASLYVLSGSFDKLTNLAVFVMWIFFVMCVCGIFILRRKHKELKTSYKVPLYPIVPLIGIVGGLYILISTFITDSLSAIYGIGITLIGLPVYFYIRKKYKRD
ncbi:APC family permease [Clostridium beijerinckii]|uniref:APC family permease n=1 Tax=Clostridium beijerinckii TaxID=1520 RepID=UPI00080A6378|nr:amino acid permease [Clostridium beijerinckii]OCA97029.1 amino acid permease [Clostridium beijerinckii]